MDTPTPPPMSTTFDHQVSSTPKAVLVPGSIIVGAGPSGLAVAASLHCLSLPSLVIERSDGVADLWRYRTYDRLSLHLPKRFCQLPHLPFPSYFPEYPSRIQFLHYLNSYAQHFSIHPLFRCTVVEARFDAASSLWHVTTVGNSMEVVEYVSQWLVVATGENAEAVVPEMKGREGFKGSVMHSSHYKSGVGYKGKKVLVVGCGNSGMEMCLDLCENGALPYMSIRTGVHVLPREILGTSTFGLAMKLMKWLPVKLVDKLLLMGAKMVLGDTEKYGLERPKMGPIELKNTTGKTPVLDVGAFKLIKDGRIKIVPEVETLTSHGAKFVDGGEMGFDSVVFATGYKSNVPFWLKGCDFFNEDGKPKTPLPNGGKGVNGLYFVGFTGRGLLGAGDDAIKTALDIADGGGEWMNKNPSKQRNFGALQETLHVSILTRQKKSGDLKKP